MNDFDDIGAAGEFSYVFENEESFLDSDDAEDLLHDCQDPMVDYYDDVSAEPPDEELDGIDAVSFGLGLGLGAELAAGEKNKTEMLRHINEIQTPVDIDEHTDSENIQKARQQMTSLRANKPKRHKTAFENFMDDIYSGRKSLWDD